MSSQLTHRIFNRLAKALIRLQVCVAQIKYFLVNWFRSSFVIHCQPPERGHIAGIYDKFDTGPRSAVGNVSGYRCVSECRSRVASSIPARYHTFVEIDHEIISTVILLPSADLFKKGCCQLQAKVCAQITGKPLAQACPGKSVVKWTDRPAMTIAVDMGRKATKTNKQWQRTSDTLIGYLPIFQMLPKTSLCIRYDWYPFE